MSLRDILRWPDPRLARVCAPVVDIAAVQDLIADMFETVYAAPGRGLAAPQVGVLARVFVMDAGWKAGTPSPLVCINPEIAETSQARVLSPEGCLSIPGVQAEVLRAERITLAWTDADGARQQRQLTGFEALCAQHELDHLNGIVTFDRLDGSERAALIATYERRA